MSRQAGSGNIAGGCVRQLLVHPQSPFCPALPESSQQDAHAIIRSLCRVQLGWLPRHVFCMPLYMQMDAYPAMTNI